MSFPSDEEKTLIIPARWMNGEWKPFYGGSMPKLNEGTLAEIIVPQAAFIDSSEIRRFSIEDEIVIQKAGSTLWAAMSPNFGMGGPKLGFPANVRTRPQDGLEKVNLVGFLIEEDLLLRLRGTKKALLENCRCKLEELPPEVLVQSVNQAYTRLSERYEAKRTSHTGNVFDKVFCRDAGLLVPLDELRQQAVANLEKRLFLESGEFPA